MLRPPTLLLTLSTALAACTTGLTPIAEYGEDTGADVDTGADSDVDTDAGTDAPANTPPTADAGDDATANSGSVVLLDGSNSFDADGDELSFAWAFADLPSTSGATILNDFREDPQFYADVAGVYEVELIVDDGIDSATDTVIITVTDANGAPVANAGPDQSVSAAASVQLNGGNSTDPDGDSLNYTWSFTSRPSGSAAVLSSTFSPTPRFTADLAGTYVVSLVVDDGTLTSSPDTVQITAAGSSSGGGDCGDCGTYVESEVRRRAQTGSAASALGLFSLPFLVLFWQRRR